MIPLFKVHMSEEAVKESSKVLDSGYIGQGQIVDEFERNLSNYLGLHKRFIMTTNSATSAEHLALHMLKKKGTLTEPFPEFGGAVVNKWDGCDIRVFC